MHHYDIDKMNITEKEKNALKYHERKELIYAAAKQMQDGNKGAGLLYNELEKVPSKTYTIFDKSQYRSAIENPLGNEKTLRELSQFLERVSMPYRRLLWYYASIPRFYWNLQPKISLAEQIDEQQILQQYEEMCRVVESLDIQQEMKNVLFFALRDGAFYGFIYEDDNSRFIHRLNPDYCRPVQLEAGVFNFAFDFNYFKKYPKALETWDPVFQQMYDAYQKDTTNMRWQIIDPERSICIKADADLDETLPFFLGIFESLIDLIDARTLQRNKDVIENYKLILQKIPLFSETGSKDTDDFRLEVDTVLAFNQRIEDNAPSGIGVVTTPMEIDTVDFKSDETSSDLISASMKSVFDDSGTSQMLFNAEKSGSIGLDASIKTDISLSWIIVESIERWMKRYVRYNSSSIEFLFEILDVNVFNKDNAVELELRLANSGVPNKVKLAATAGITPLDLMSSQIFENQILKVHENWIPLQTSYTMSSGDVGRPSSTELNDQTQKSIDTNANQDEVDV